MSFNIRTCSWDLIWVVERCDQVLITRDYHGINSCNKINCTQCIVNITLCLLFIPKNSRRIPQKPGFDKKYFCRNGNFFPI